MTAKDADVGVVGTGAWGVNALWRLAARGVKVIGFDTQAVPNPYGSTHGRTRLFRVACHEHVALTPIARRARDLWYELSKAQGVELLTQTGLLSIGPEGGRALGNMTKAATAAGTELTRFAVDELRERWPQHANLADHWVGIFDHEAGTVRVEEAVTAAAAAARGAGATLYENTKVLDILDDGDGVIVRTEDHDYRVGQVILASGAWMARMQDIVKLKPVRVPLFWWQARHSSHEFKIERFPAFIRHYDDEHTIWGHGSNTGDGLVKVGASSDSNFMYVDPDTVLRGIRPHIDWKTLSDVLPMAIPGLSPTPVLAAPCMITESPDGQFVIGRHPDRPNVILAGGCDGHGYKHATAIGEILAQFAVDEPSFTDIDFMRPDRFR
ncbi:N-methyl-L-tryptophan oxidase [Streptomyces chartreusis]|uniref:N-methyl-L-tryptophan oxidase n=1 Tax=Streptomyces chartreusis TaxID=1969 RepID=UPI0033D19FC1